MWDNKDEGPLLTKCGFREDTFEGVDTREKFGTWLFTNQHQYFKVFAHNMKGYDGYFLLEYIINQSMHPEKIIYNVSKIMYMTVERSLHIKMIDSLNFLPMKLSTLPKAFGINELKKGWFPHYLYTLENQIMWDPILTLNTMDVTSWVRRKEKKCYCGLMRERMMCLILEKKFYKIVEVIF